MDKAQKLFLEGIEYDDIRDALRPLVIAGNGAAFTMAVQAEREKQRLYTEAMNAAEESKNENSEA